MDILKILEPDYLGKIFLIFARVAGFIMIVPIFGRQNTPALVKVGFSVFLTLVLLNFTNFTDVKIGGGLYNYAFLLFKEIMAGLLLGFISYAMFTAIYVAGQLIDMKIGFGVVNILDPVSNIQVPITSNLYFIFTMVIFMTLKGHHLLIDSLFKSYLYIPLGNPNFGDGLMDEIINIFGGVFILGFKIAAPTAAAVLIADVALGVISRTIPQFNVFIVGMPIKIALGIALMLVSIPIFVEVITTLFLEVDKKMLVFIREMVGS